MIKGKAKIQLFDAKTGEETYSASSENMVTNALKNILNPDVGIMMSSNFFAPLCINSTPLGEKLLSGIMLFGSTLAEDADNIIVPAGVSEIGHAGTAYSGTNVYRGSLNENESGAIEGGYRYVWDFASDKANGTINCLSLTSKFGGNTGFHCIGESDEAAFLTPMNVNSESASSGIYPSRGLACALCSLSNGKYIYGIVSGNTLTLSTYKNVSRSAVKITDNVTSYGADTLDSQVTLTTSFSSLPSISRSFVTEDGKLCFLWKSSTNGVMNYVRVNLSTKTFEEQSEITLSDGAVASTTYPHIAQLGGYFYITMNSTTIAKYTTSGVYAGSFAISALNAHPSVIDGKLYYVTSNTSIMTVINGDEIETVRRGSSCSISETAAVSSVAVKAPYIIFSTRIDSSSYDLSELYIRSNYLGTINNLAEPIVKTTNSTMKITYDIVNA